VPATAPSRTHGKAVYGVEIPRNIKKNSAGRFPDWRPGSEWEAVMTEPKGWIAARDAQRLVRDVGGDIEARQTICKRAHRGLIRAQAEQFVRNGRVEGKVDIPKGFWWAGGEEALEQNWAAGDFETWIQNGSVRLQAYGVSFCQEDIEKLCGGAESSHVLRAYENLDLHAGIAAAASQLYRDGHYANAIEDAVKALNGLVRQRSGKDDLDGTTLMEHVFNPNKPILRFNDLADQSDRDEQKGFMMMFSGAVAGLRNPRAHRLIKDDPERALEFIAYISLLAKLVDGAKKAAA
jgi:uncharacterized protein (TIGR02391 family)